MVSTIPSYWLMVLGGAEKQKSRDIGHEVAVLVVSGLLSEKGGGELGIRETTVKVYRAAKQSRRWASQ